MFLWRKKQASICYIASQTIHLRSNLGMVGMIAANTTIQPRVCVVYVPLDVRPDVRPDVWCVATSGPAWFDGSSGFYRLHVVLVYRTCVYLLLHPGRHKTNRSQKKCANIYWHFWKSLFHIVSMYKTNTLDKWHDNLTSLHVTLYDPWDWCNYPKPAIFIRIVDYSTLVTLIGNNSCYIIVQ